MKLFVTVTLLVCIFACCEGNISNEDKQKLKKKFGTCMGKSGAQQSVLQLLLSSNFNKMDNDGKAKCFVECLMEETKFLENGKINEQKIRRKAQGILGDNDVQKLLQCQYTPKPGCDDEYDVYKCFLGKAPILKQLLLSLQSELSS